MTVRAVVVYESMYGNTHAVADAVGQGLRAVDGADVLVVSAGLATPGILAGADLVVVGGPTHAHGMSREMTRRSAMDAAHKPGSGLRIEPGASGPGIRHWLEALPTPPSRMATFDTRAAGPTALTRRVSTRIAKVLERRGVESIAGPESFFVTRTNRLAAGELDRAIEWGRRLGRRCERELAASGG